MSDLISREALMYEVMGLTIVSPGVMNYANAVALAIADAPAIEAEPVRHGCWFPYSVVGKPLFRYQCGVCHHWVDGGTDRNFCPNCGAKMDLED